MTIATENHPIHKWQGIVSAVIGMTSVLFNVLPVGMVMSGAVPTGAMDTALSALPGTMLCANLIGIVLGVVGARDRASKKVYPRLGLILNIAIVMTLLMLALVGLSMTSS